MFGRMQILFIFIYIILLIASLVIERFRYKAHITPITMFSIVWCIVGIASNTGYFDYYLPSNEVNLAIILSIIIIDISWGLIGRATGTLLDDISEQLNKFDFNLLSLTILEIILFIMIFPQLRQSLRILQSYSFIILRGADVYGVSEELGYSNQLISIFVRPGYTLVSLMTAVSFFNPVEKKKRISLIIFTVFNLVIFTITTAGRILIVNTIMYIVLSALVYSKGSISKFLSERKRVIIPVALLGIALLYVQKLRSPDANIIDTIYVYYCSGPSFLTQIIERNQNTFKINSDFMWGSATFGFLTNMISYVLIYFTGKPQGSLYMLGSVLTNYNIRIGEHTNINAMCTCFYDFLLDWGTFGMLLGPIIVSLIAKQVYKKARSRHSWADICVLIYIMNILIRTVFKWELISTEFTMILIYLFIFTRIRFGFAQRKAF